MSRHNPISSLSEFWQLDPAEIKEGYADGAVVEGEGFTECGDNRSRAYWHGWCNAMRDRGRLPVWDINSSLFAEATAFGGWAAVFAHHDRVYPQFKALGIAE